MEIKLWQLDDKVANKTILAKSSRHVSACQIQPIETHLRMSVLLCRRLRDDEERIAALSTSPVSRVTTLATVQNYPCPGIISSQSMSILGTTWAYSTTSAPAALARQTSVVVFAGPIFRKRSSDQWRRCPIQLRTASTRISLVGSFHQTAHKKLTPVRANSNL